MNLCCPLYWGGGSLETETVRSSFWIPFEVRWQGRLGPFPKWLGSQLGCCHSVNTAERRSREYSLDICSRHRTLSHSTILGTNTVKTSNSGRNAGAWSHSHIFFGNIHCDRPPFHKQVFNSQESRGRTHWSDWGRFSWTYVGRHTTSQDILS